MRHPSLPLFRGALLFAAFGLVLGTSALAAGVAAPSLAIGDTWTYRHVDEFGGREVGTISRAVAAAGAGNIQIVTRSHDGKILGQSRFTAPGLLAAGTLNPRAAGTMKPALQLAPYPLREGETWSQQVVRDDDLTHEMRTTQLSGKVVGWETVTVPAGEFRALRIERSMDLGDEGAFRGATQRHETEWYAPEVRGPVKVEVYEEFLEDRFNNCFGPKPGTRATYELLRFTSG